MRPREVKAVLLDVEGTLCVHGVALPGAVSAVAALRESGLAIRYLTNVESRRPQAIADELTASGFDVRPGELHTPISAALALFAKTSDAHVLPLVSDSLRGLFPTASAPPFTHVLVGDCREVLGYPMLDVAFRALRAGAELVALQRGRYFKRPDGDHLDSGAIVAALEYSAQVAAQVVGKPSAEFFRTAAADAGVPIDACLVVGDDVSTDIEGGLAAGAQVIQVRTGKYADQVRAGQVSPAVKTVGSVVDLPWMWS
ncbi:HAD hydrolase-like protein [Amycolatopsis sp. NPDC059657]|uniref:HAD hydrolase-like protein n=1 Tax=Amycolatopsis sp. NPDC059657 TaxID=3346899 RepID=UPI003672554A